MAPTHTPRTIPTPTDTAPTPTDTAPTPTDAIGANATWAVLVPEARP